MGGRDSCEALGHDRRGVRCPRCRDRRGAARCRGPVRAVARQPGGGFGACGLRCRCRGLVDVAAWWPFAAPPAFEVLFPLGVDLVVLNGAPLELAGRITLNGRVLFDDDPPGAGSAGPSPCARSTPTSSRGCGAATTSSPRLYDVADEVRVLRLLRSISDDLAVLRAEASADAGRRADQIVTYAATGACVRRLPGSAAGSPPRPAPASCGPAFPRAVERQHRSRRRTHAVSHPVT